VAEKRGPARVGGQSPGCWCSTTANTCWTPPRIWSRPILAASATVNDSRDQPRRDWGVSEEQLWACPGRSTSTSETESARRETFFPRPCPKCRVGPSRWPSPGEADAGGGNLPQTRRHPVSHRVGGLTDGIDDRQARCVIVSISGSGCWSAPGAALATPPHTLRPRGGVVLRPSRRHRKRQCWTAVFGSFAGGFDLESACAVADFR